MTGSTACAAGAIIAAGLALARLAAAASPLAMSCLGCHQPRVNAPTMPDLARTRASQIAASLKAARDSPANGSIMARFAAGLSESDIDALAHELGQAD